MDVCLSPASDATYAGACFIALRTEDIAMPSSPAEPLPLEQRSSAPVPPGVSRTSLPALSSTWLCLPPGATLRAERGRLAVSTAPVMCGQVFVTQMPPLMLDAGHGWSAPAASGATWVHLSNAGPGAALVTITPPEQAVERQASGWISAGLALAIRLLRRPGAHPVPGAAPQA